MPEARREKAAPRQLTPGLVQVRRAHRARAQVHPGRHGAAGGATPAWPTSCGARARRAAPTRPSTSARRPRTGARARR
eukprot:2719188-Alexandrium_andersonii.AAC.1